MSASMSHAASAEPNLTPILDMVFQLITFFMLVINFKAQAMDLTLKLPILGSARPVKVGEGDSDFIVLNIDSKGGLKVGGIEKKLPEFIKQEAQRSLDQHPGTNAQLGDGLLTSIVLRADQNTPFSTLNQVIKTCQASGFRKFLLKAMNKKME